MSEESSPEPSLVSFVSTGPAFPALPSRPALCSDAGDFHFAPADRGVSEPIKKSNLHIASFNVRWDGMHDLNVQSVADFASA